MEFRRTFSAFVAKMACLSCLLSATLSVPLWGQQDANDPVFARLYGFMVNVASYDSNTPQENVYLHLDNNAYFLGETLWFKAYVVRASNLLPTDMSRVLYVELIAPDGGIMQRRKLKVENGQAWGDFDLSKVVRSGFYEVRAYTRVMLNWDASYIFSRVVPVFDTPTEKGIYTSRTTFAHQFNVKERVFYSRKPAPRAEGEQENDSLRLTFYPEGGWLVEGVSSNVAFQLTDAKGRPADLPCRLYTADSVMVGEFRPQHDGRGVFPLVGDVQGGYVSVRRKERSVCFPLPVPRPSGYVMTVDNYSQPGLTSVLLRGSEDRKPELLGLAVTCRGAGVYFDTLRVGPSVQNLRFEHVALRAGVNQLTLFDRSGRVLAERLFYCPAARDGLHLQARFDKEQYDACSPVNLSLELKNSRGKGVQSVFSMAIRDANGELAGRYSSMEEQLLFLSDLKGYIAHPSYYFEADDSLHRRHLDLLLMVQGWRRYEWDELAGRRPFNLKHPIEEGLLVDGRVEERWKKEKAENISLNVIAYTPEGIVMRGDCPLDTAGKFHYMFMDFDGNAHAQYATRRKGKLKRMRVVMNRNFEPPAVEYGPGQDSLIPLPVQWKAPKTRKVQPADTTKRPFIRPASALPEVSVKAKRIKNRLTYDGGEEVGKRYMDRSFNMKEEEERMRDDGYITELITFEGWLLWRFPEFNPIKHKTGEYYIVQIHNNHFLGLFGRKHEDLSERNKRNIELRRKRKNRGKEFSPDEYELSDSRSVFDLYRTVMIVQNPEVYKQFVSAMDLREVGIPVNALDKILCIFTYDKIFDLNMQMKGYQQFNMRGYDIPRACYQPKYGTLDEPTAEDFRRTLYWNPNVRTDRIGRASVEFMTNSRKNVRFHISAQNISARGEILDFEE